MSRGHRPLRRGLLLVASTVATALLLAGCGSSAGGATAGPPAPSRAVGTKLDGALPARVLNLPLTDSRGRTHRLSDFDHQVVVISDSMTLCQETCPLDTSGLVQTARDVARTKSADDVVFLTITVDPERDTVPQLAAYRRLFSPAPRNWLLLTGTPARIDRLWDTFGVYRKRVADDDGPAPRSWRTGTKLTYDVEHSDEVFFLDQDSHERFVIEGTPQVPGRKAIPTPLYRFLSGDGHRNVDHPDGSAWTPGEALDVIGWLTHRRLAA